MACAKASGGSGVLGLPSELASWAKDPTVDSAAIVGIFEVEGMTEASYSASSSSSPSSSISEVADPYSKVLWIQLSSIFRYPMWWRDLSLSISMEQFLSILPIIEYSELKKKV